MLKVASFASALIAINNKKEPFGSFLFDVFTLQTKKSSSNDELFYRMVPRAGLEPAQRERRGIL
ncbi:hypothetical protein, partial [Photobacterium angustum]|uniref:hypothetical protein n=1 Tax=Photobacterium angustum TaxID=661 RepID=UPI001F48B770